MRLGLKLTEDANSRDSARHLASDMHSLHDTVEVRTPPELS